ncbi:hypothetical protein CEE44_02280 [Candidatus Woesearchaeota archaeon B3_Woes]|nr:MAG: hypothetical protein CEE44_02280 [Candidatus Woesearchaeota archaeon B3_Woes]
MTNYTKKAIHGAGYVFIISVLSAFFGYLLRLLLARNLTQTEYGMFYAIYSLSIFSIIFNNLGTGQALVKFIPEFKTNKKFNLIKNSIINVSIIQLVISTIIVIILFASSDFLALNYFHNLQASLIIKLFAFIFFFRSFLSLLVYIFQGFQKMKYFAFVDFLRTFLIFIIASGGFILFGKNILVPTIAYLFAPLILLPFFYFFFFKKTFPLFSKLKYSFDKNLMKKLVLFGAPLMLMVVGIMILNHTDTLMLTYFSGLDQVGLYNAALPTANVLGYFSIALMTVLFPLSSELWTKGHKKQLIEGINTLYKYSFITIFPIALTMFSFPETILNILFGNTYIQASNVLRILSLGVILMTITRINFSAISGIGKPKLNARIILIGAIFNLILNFILIPLYGMMGAAITTFFGYLLMMGLSISNLKKLVKIHIPFKYWTKSLFIGLIFISLISYLKYALVLNVYLEIIIIFGIVGLIYIVLVFLFNLLTIKEVKKIVKRVI